MSDADFRPRSKLSLEAEEAIRSYLVRIMIPSGVVLSIIAGALGFVASGIAQITMGEQALQKATEAALKASEANGSATLAASAAAAAREKALKIADEISQVKSSVQSMTDERVTAIAGELVKNPQFLNQISTNQLNEVNLRLEKLSKNGVMAAGIISGGTLTVATPGVQFDPIAGRISFNNPNLAKFVPLVNIVSFNKSYITTTCFLRSIDVGSIVIAASALDTGGRVFPAADCTFAIVGVEG